MGRKINRTGEENINTFGSKMIIKEYRGCMDIDVYFPEYDWVLKNTRYGDFKNRKIKCPYEPRYYGVGYLGEGNIRCLKMVKIKENIKFGTVCCEDVMILNFIKENLRMKGVWLKIIY